MSRLQWLCTYSESERGIKTYKIIYPYQWEDLSVSNALWPSLFTARMFSFKFTVFVHRRYKRPWLWLRLHRGFEQARYLKLQVLSSCLLFANEKISIMIIPVSRTDVGLSGTLSTLPRGSSTSLAQNSWFFHKLCLNCFLTSVKVRLQ